MWSLEDSGLLTVNGKNFLRVKGEGRVSSVWSKVGGGELHIASKWFVTQTAQPPKSKPKKKPKTLN